MNKFEILVDIDYKPKRWIKWVKDFVNKLIFLNEQAGIEFGKVTVYETEKGLHLYIDAYSPYKISNKDICLLQLALGSDYKREIFNWLRIRGNYRGKWNVLFIDKERKSEYAVKIESEINRRLSVYECSMKLG